MPRRRGHTNQAGPAPLAPPDAGGGGAELLPLAHGGDGAALMPAAWTRPHWPRSLLALLSQVAAAADSSGQTAASRVEQQ